MKIIEQYIQFAIDNGYEFGGDYFYEADEEDIWLRNDIDAYYNLSLHRIITSKEFIEAIARGLQKEEKSIKKIIFNKFLIDYTNANKASLIDAITEKQAIAIRDNKLEEFITDLLGDK